MCDGNCFDGVAKLRLRDEMSIERFNTANIYAMGHRLRRSVGIWHPSP
jgi:hypothetical protein